MSEDIARVGAVETRGIEPVPDEERHGKPSGLFWMWFAANMGVVGVTLGAALTALSHLNVWQALLVATLGSVGSFAMVGALAVAGKRGGAPGLTLSRAVFGVRGNLGPTLVSWISLVGWETIMCTTASYALHDLLHKIFGVGRSNGLIALCLLVTVTIAATIGLLGHATILFIQRWLTWVFGVLTLVVVAFLAADVNWDKAVSAPAAPTTAVIAAIGFIAAGTGIGWLSAGADYARYLPRRVHGRSIIGASAIGAAIPLIVLIMMGSLLAADDQALAAATDPVAAVGDPLPTWMAIPYLLTAVIGLITAADLSMYSSGLNLLAGGIKIRRTSAVAVDAVLIILGGLYITVIAADFYGPFNTFLTLLAVPMSAWAGVFGIDMLTRRSYDPNGLMTMHRGGVYWYSGGIRWTAVVPWLAGILAGFAYTVAANGEDVWFKGSFADSWLGQHGLGWAVSGVLAGVLYTALGEIRRRIGTPRRTTEPYPEGLAQ
ncbi:purine-cytosine permease family protein [Spirillospora sp. CA-108201]